MLQLSRSILDRSASVVSGGEKQRLAIVRALLLDKEIFLHTSMLVIYGLLLFPVMFSLLLRLGLVRSILISVLRMTAQMAVLGLYLDYLFRLNNILVNFGWVLLMITSIHPDPFYDARYLIPITGMVVGNCMRANVISLERFFTSIRKNEKEFLTYLSLRISFNEYQILRKDIFRES